MAGYKATTIEELLLSIDKSGRSYDKDIIIKAYEIADKAHGGQCRMSGEPYISHPLSVAVILVDLGMDLETVTAAILHDVVEDTDVSIDEIKKLFGGDVANIVEGVTKIGKIPFSTKEEQQAENVRKMLLAMAEDVRVIITKLADRLHNMRTLAAMPEQKQRDKARETMEVYAPIAHRLGISAIKDELEDTSLKYLDNIAYGEIEARLSRSREEQHEFLEHITEKIKDRTDHDGLKSSITNRIKSIYGIYRKVYMQGRDFEEIFDIYAVRIIVESIADCYNALGVIHDIFTPIPNRFKDYISTPKNNMYQSLHTTLLDKEGIPFEVQIRTWDMHYTAEYGIAAHWKYKAGVSGKDKLEERLAWVRQLLESQKESEDVQDIMLSIKTDIAPEEVFVFTPKGKLISLPVGATVIDFAYAIHTAIGHRMTGAKVDGRIVSLDFEVKTGMVVEILTSNSPNHGPSRDWINIVCTTSTRNKIRNWFKKERRDENILEGKIELEREMKRNAVAIPEADYAKFMDDISAKHHYNTLEDMYAAIGYGGITVSKVFPKIRDEYIKLYKTTEQDIIDSAMKAPKKPKKASSGVIVEGLDSCLVKFAKCCNPLPGDEIIGFITRGYGVSIHKQDCINVTSVINNEDQKGRWLNSHWSQVATKETFKSTIEIIADDRPGLLADVSIIIGNLHIPIHSLIAREAKDGLVSITVTLGISSIPQLNQIMSSIRKVERVNSVERSTQ